VARDHIDTRVIMKSGCTINISAHPPALGDEIEMAVESARSTYVAAFDILFDSTTGHFVGYGSLFPGNLVFLHPRAGRDLLSDPPLRQLNLRMQIFNESGDSEVRDGTVLLPTPSSGADLPPAVSVHGETIADPLDYDWQSPASDLECLLADLERQEPGQPPESTPTAPTGVLGVPGLRPPWCRFLPSCPGC
jgi:hypothetical protein